MESTNGGVGTVEWERYPHITLIQRSNVGRYAQLMGPPAVTVDQMIQWAAHWMRIGGESLNKPTHYEARDGKF